MSTPTTDRFDISSVRDVMNNSLDQIIDFMRGDNQLSSSLKEQIFQSLLEKEMAAIVAAKESQILSTHSLDALVIAQAAEKTFRLAHLIDVVASKHDSLIEENRPLPHGSKKILSTAGLIEYDDLVFKTSFKFLDLGMYTQQVVRAQAIRLCAQLLLNNDIIATNQEILSPEFEGRHLLQGFDAAVIFKTEAAKLYLEASDLMLKNEELGAVAQVFKSVAGKLRPSPTALALSSIKPKERTPWNVMHKILFDYNRGTIAMAVELGGTDHGVLSTYPDCIAKLCHLVDPRSREEPQRGEVFHKIARAKLVQ